MSMNARVWSMALVVGLLGCALPLAGAVAADGPAASAEHPLGWRGDGVGSYPDAHPPLTWSNPRNVLWRAAAATSVSSPVVCGRRVLCCAEPYTLMSLDRDTGAIEWKLEATMLNATPPEQRDALVRRREEAKPYLDRKVEVERTFWDTWRRLQAKPDDAELKGALQDLQGKVDQAQRAYYVDYGDVVDPPVHSFGYSFLTPVTDGVHVWTVFLNGVAVCAEVSGKPTWMRRIFVPPPRDGVAGSPLLVDGKLIISYAGVIALDPATGAQLWSTPTKASWGTPVPVTLGRTKAILSPTGDLIRAHDGHRIGSLFEPCAHASPIIHDGVAYMIERDAIAVRLPDSDADDPKPQVLWRIDGLFEPDGADNMLTSSPLYDDGIVYAIGNHGPLVALAADSGTRFYTHPLSGEFNQCIVRAGDNLLVGNSGGALVVFDRGPAYREVASPQLGAWNVSNPVFIGDRIYARGGDQLLCLCAATTVGVAPAR